MDVGFLGQPEIEGIGIGDQVDRAWSTRTGWQPSPQGKCIQNGEYRQGKARQGQWRTKATSRTPETERLSKRLYADVEQIHPKTNQAAPVPFHHLTKEPESSEPEVTSLPQIRSTTNLERRKSRFPARDFVARAQPRY